VVTGTDVVAGARVVTAGAVVAVDVVVTAHRQRMSHLPLSGTPKALFSIQAGEWNACQRTCRGGDRSGCCGGCQCCDRDCCGSCKVAKQ